MARELEVAVATLVAQVLDAGTGETPTWLLRPGREESGERWSLVCQVYADLTGLALPETMPLRESRTVDAVLIARNQPPRILEVDEKQHFNPYRARTLQHYREKVPLAFDPDVWIQVAERKTRLEGGGFGVPKPPLFPGDGGRHRQRAFRDALCDILPPENGWLPTLRIAHFEVERWVFTSGAEERMRGLLDKKLRGDGR